jgi:hypothetical protein
MSTTTTPRPTAAALRQSALLTARENLAYWRMKHAQATNPRLKIDAGARVIAWQMQIQRLTQP